MRVFIVENSSIIRERLAALLSDFQGVELAGYAEDVGEAVSSIRRARPDVVILDIQMPGGGGFSVLRDIREQALPTVVIIFTNDPFPQYRQRFINAGADFFLDKSAEFEELLEIFKGLSNPSNIERVY